MNSYSYQALCDLRKNLGEFLTSLQLAIPAESWLNRIFDLAINANNSYQDGILWGNFLDRENKRGDIHYGFLDLISVKEILPYILNEEANLMKTKLKHVLRISAPYDESKLNNNARNILWELDLFSRFKMANVSAVLGDPNPDVLVQIESRKYYIQCKRIFGNKNITLRNIIQDAVKQLQRDLQNQDDNAFGIIALSLERPFAEMISNLFVNTTSGIDGLKFLSDVLKNFIDNHKNLLADQNLIRNRKIKGIMFYISHPSIVENKILAKASYIVFTNTWPPDRIFLDTISRDFLQMKEYFGS